MDFTEEEIKELGKYTQGISNRLHIKTEREHTCRQTRNF